MDFENMTKEDIEVMERIVNDNLRKQKEAAEAKKQEEHKAFKHRVCGSASCDCTEITEPPKTPGFGGGGGDDWGINPGTGDSGDILFYGLLVLISIFMLVIFNYKPKSYYKKY